jgi:putative mRNA 3-end processing factor
MDPKATCKAAVISHAHADHAISGNNESVLYRELQLPFMQLRYDRKTAAKAFNIVGYNRQPFNIGMCRSPSYICRAHAGFGTGY